VGGRVAGSARATAGHAPARVAGLPEPGRCLVMGILNVTPDSFSDGGAYFSPARAIDHGLELAASGADIIDVGGESTRPGARPVPLSQELCRVLPVVRELSRAGVLVSIDTMHASVAAAALDAGARLLNGGTAAPVALHAIARTRGRSADQLGDYRAGLASSATDLRPASVPLRSAAVIPPVSDLSTRSTMLAASR
jgi:hypothetical protein